MKLRFSSEADLPEHMGATIYSLIRDLYPINRSITGDGLRATVAEIGKIIELTVHEVPTGTRVFDWEVPDEWNIRDASIKDMDGKRIVDFRMSNLHVVSYSTPVDRTMTLEDLRPHLHSLPEHPDWIPYRTSYYSKDWGFCLTHRTLMQMEEGEYHVHIDSDLRPGTLTYAEHVVPGQTDDEVLFFAHTCHPSLCNDNLSGIALATFLARELSKHSVKYTYRFVFAPATIGSITWLARNEKRLSKIRHGLVLSVIGDQGHMTYKRSRISHAEIDRAATHVLNLVLGDGEIQEFSPWGYDERQFCSPGINLPVGRLTRTPNGAYPEYHTSADDLTVVEPEYLAHSFDAVWQILRVLEDNTTLLNTLGKGEPQLGRRGMYRIMGGYQDVERLQLAMLWVLNQSDGQHSLLDIAEKAQLPFSLIWTAARDLVEAEFLVEDTTRP